MKYTKKQRREIYLKAAESILNNENIFCCDAIVETVNYEGNIYSGNVPMFFKELGLFKPDIRNISWIGGWFGDSLTIETKSDRLNCLLFCAEMCNDSIF